MKILYQQMNKGKNEAFLCVWGCPCGTVFSVENHDDYVIQADMGSTWIEVHCPHCRKKHTHEVPLTDAERVLYSYIHLLEGEDEIR